MVKAYIALTGPYSIFQDEGIIIVETKKIIPRSTKVVNADYARYTCEENKGIVIKILKLINKRAFEKVSSINNFFHVGKEIVWTNHIYHIYKTFRAAYACIKYIKNFSGWCSRYHNNGRLTDKILYYNGTLVKSIYKGNEIIIKRYYKKNYSLIKTIDGHVIQRYKGIFYHHDDSDIFYSWYLTNGGKETYYIQNKRTHTWFEKNNFMYCTLCGDGDFQLKSRSGVISHKVISLLQRIQSVVIKKNAKKIY
jgi:hypothetical protein